MSRANSQVTEHFQDHAHPSQDQSRKGKGHSDHQDTDDYDNRAGNRDDPRYGAVFENRAKEPLEPQPGLGCRRYMLAATIRAVLIEIKCGFGLTASRISAPAVSARRCICQGGARKHLRQDSGAFLSAYTLV